MSKFIKHSGHCYTVINQNSFNNALYDYFECDKENRSKESVRSMIQNFPTQYPITIIIIDLSFECNRVYIEYININEIDHNSDGYENLIYNNK